MLITRVYVIDRAGDLDDPTLRELVWADVSAGLDVRYMLTRYLPTQHAIDFGIWDDELLAEIHYAAEPDGSPRLHRCHYWSDTHRLNRAREWRRAIERAARPCPYLPSERTLLEESAKLSLDNGCCTIDAAHKPDCSPYHISWQPLRLCDVVSTPRWHSTFYAERFRQWSDTVQSSEKAVRDAEQTVRDAGEPNKLNVLITGLADYAMLYWIAQSIAPSVLERCRFHVLDICQTPLDSCRWLQRRLLRCSPPLRLDLEVYRQNIFENELQKGSYDLIASDAFLTRFEHAEEKRALMKEWMSLLRVGGMLVTTARVREDPDDITSADRERFVRRVAEIAGERGLDIDVESIAEHYAGYIESYPLASEASLRELVDSTVGGQAPWRIEFAFIDDQEMTPANYGRVTVGGQAS